MSIEALLTAHGPTLLIGALTIAAGAITSHITSSKQAARFEGAANARLDAHDRRFETIETEQASQWKSIRETDKTVSELKGRIEGTPLKTARAHMGGD